MIGFNAENDGNGGRFFQVPELEGGEFVNDNVFFFEFGEDVESGSSDIAD